MEVSLQILYWKLECVKMDADLLTIKVDLISKVDCIRQKLRALNNRARNVFTFSHIIT